MTDNPWRVALCRDVECRSDERHWVILDRKGNVFGVWRTLTEACDDARGMEP